MKRVAVHQRTPLPSHNDHIYIIPPPNIRRILTCAFIAGRSTELYLIQRTTRMQNHIYPKQCNIVGFVRSAARGGTERRRRPRERECAASTALHAPRAPPYTIWKRKLTLTTDTKLSTTHHPFQYSTKQAANLPSSSGEHGWQVARRRRVYVRVQRSVGGRCLCCCCAGLLGWGFVDVLGRLGHRVVKSAVSGIKTLQAAE
jgi:hypothetical protein